MSEALLDWLWALFDREPDGAFVELRQLGGGRLPHREFHPVANLERVAERAVELGRERDTYAGVAPRRRRAGGKDAIGHTWVLHADVDGPAAVDRLAGFEPAPTLVVWSGSGGAHAYWRLRERAVPASAEAANRRLAHALDADAQSVDVSRILRPPETFNGKHDPPARVVLDRWRGGTLALDQVVGRLPDPPETRTSRARGTCTREQRSARAENLGRVDGDSLLTIEPAVYVAALTGRRPGRDGKVACPLHDERNASLHVYPTAEQGWFCFGCGRGGSIYDLARELSGIGDRGADFARLRDWIARRLLHAPLRSAA